jgi:hypothetical protein
MARRPDSSAMFALTTDSPTRYLLADSACLDRLELTAASLHIADGLLPDSPALAAQQLALPFTLVAGRMTSSRGRFVGRGEDPSSR